MRKIVLVLFVMVGALQAKQWYVINEKKLKCQKHNYSPYDYRNVLGGEIIGKDGMFLYLGPKGGSMVFATSMKKCNQVKNNR